MFLLTGVSLDSNNDNFLTALSPAKLQVRNIYEYDDIALLESHGKGGHLQDTQYFRYFDFLMKLGRWVLVQFVCINRLRGCLDIRVQEGKQIHHTHTHLTVSPILRP